MKKSWKKSIKIGVSLLLVLCTVFGNLTVAFAAGDKGTIKYVSLGDSMTNGYAMSSGYTNDNQGFQNTAADIYPTQFKDYLEQKGYTVDFYQYAMSAFRAEELRFLLNQPENWNQMPLAGRWRDVQETWESVFDFGDGWTYTQFTGYNKRFPKIFGDPNCLASYDLVNWVLTGTENAVSTYNAAVKDADLISMAYGNAGMGAFCMQYLLDALDNISDIPNLKNELKLDRQIAQLDPELAEKVTSLQSDVEAKLKSVLSQYLDEATADYINYLIYVITYALVSHAVNYTGALGDIARVNEKDNLEIISFPIINAFNGVELYINDSVTIPLEEVYGLLLKPVNDYMEKLPTMLKLKNPALFEGITFYFAEVGTIDSVSNHYDDIHNNTIMRERVFTTVVGTESSPGRFWGLMQTPFSGFGGLKYVTLDEVRAYENDPASLTGSSEDEIKMKQLACAVYLGYEEGIVNSTKDGYITADTLLAIRDIGSLFAPAVEALVAPVTNWASGTGDLNTITSSLSTALVNDTKLNSLCNIYARFMIGDGMGKHPSAEGHQQLAEIIIDTYDVEDNVFVTILKAFFNVFLKVWQRIVGLFN